MTCSQSFPSPSPTGSGNVLDLLPTSPASPAPLPAVLLLPTPATTASTPLCPVVLRSFGHPAASPSCSELDGLHRPPAGIFICPEGHFLSHCPQTFLHLDTQDLSCTPQTHTESLTTVPYFRCLSCSRRRCLEQCQGPEQHLCHPQCPRCPRCQ